MVLGDVKKTGYPDLKLRVAPNEMNGCIQLSSADKIISLPLFPSGVNKLLLELSGWKEFTTNVTYESILVNESGLWYSNKSKLYKFQAEQCSATYHKNYLHRGGECSNVIISPGNEGTPYCNEKYSSCVHDWIKSPHLKHFKTNGIGCRLCSNCVIYIQTLFDKNGSKLFFHNWEVQCRNEIKAVHTFFHKSEKEYDIHMGMESTYKIFEQYKHVPEKQFTIHKV